MSGHPINLGLRFLLELVALASLGYWGWAYFEGPARILFAIVLPIIAGVVWATFAVPDDPSRSGNAPVPIPGAARLVFEIGLFVLAALALYFLGLQQFGIIFVVVVLAHYSVSYDRVIWLFKN